MKHMIEAAHSEHPRAWKIRAHRLAAIALALALAPASTAIASATPIERSPDRYLIQQGPEVKRLAKDIGLNLKCAQVSIARSDPRFALVVTQRGSACPDYGYGGVIVVKDRNKWAWQAAEFLPTCKMTKRIFKSLDAPASVNEDMRRGKACTGR